GIGGGAIVLIPRTGLWGGDFLPFCKAVFFRRGGDPWRGGRKSRGGPAMKEPNHRCCRLLRARRHRPRQRRAAEHRNELAPPHSITSSAMASNPGGKVSPSDLAIFRLISSSNLADCTTGSSPGRAPFKILPL